jgi:RNA-dependent RNA polymerase
MKASIRLSREMIVNLAENGVPACIFQSIMHEQLEQFVNDIIAWEKASEKDMPAAMVRLWTSVERIGHVHAARAAREDPGTARVRGLRSYDREEEEEDDEDEDGFMDEGARQEQSTAWFPDEISGCPSSLEETVMTFIEGGFTPKNNGILAEKLQFVAKKALCNLNCKYRLMIPMSCSAFCVPGVILFFLSFAICYLIFFQTPSASFKKTKYTSNVRLRRCSFQMAVERTRFPAMFLSVCPFASFLHELISGCS